MRERMLATVVALLCAGTCLAQSRYRLDSIDALGFAFEVFRGLERQPPRLDKPNPFLVARYRPSSEASGSALAAESSRGPWRCWPSIAPNRHPRPAND